MLMYMYILNTARVLSRPRIFILGSVIFRLQIINMKRPFSLQNVLHMVINLSWAITHRVGDMGVSLPKSLCILEINTSLIITVFKPSIKIFSSPIDRPLTVHWICYLNIITIIHKHVYKYT